MQKSPVQEPDYCPADAWRRVKSRWATRWSMAERLAVAERAVAVETLDTKHSRIEDTYRALYERHFGRLPTSKSMQTTQSRRAFERVQAFCNKEDISLAVFITANMDAMRFWLEEQQRTRPNVRFQPVMLSGKKAIHRYNMYVRRADNRVRGAALAVFDDRAALTQILDEMTDDEERIGYHFTICWVTGEEVCWLASAAQMEPGVYWVCLNSAYRKDFPPPREWTERVDWQRRRWGEARWTRMRQLVRLRAMVCVVNQFEPGLADRLSFRGPLRWRPLALVLRRLYGGRRQAPVQRIQGLPGVFWEMRTDATEIHAKHPFD